jgi:hypothetical protein
MNDVTADRLSDAELANAYRELEDIISNVRDACLLMEVAAEDTVMADETDFEKWIRGKIGGDGMPGYKIWVSTKNEAVAICYAMNHLGNLVRKLHEEYYAGWSKPA